MRVNPAHRGTVELGSATVGIALLAPLLAACGAGAEASGDPTEESTVPAVPSGVAEQYQTLEAEVAERGGSTTTGEWTVNYIVEAAEPWYHEHGGHQEFREPTGRETHHIEIIPVETATGRIVPDVPVRLEVVDESGEVVDAQELTFYHSTFFHYANNFAVPEEGSYTLRAEIGVPTFRRHGEEGTTPPLTEGATVTFADVSLTRD